MCNADTTGEVVNVAEVPTNDGHANGHANGNGKAAHTNPPVGSLTAGNLYQLCLEARPHFGGEWFSVTDTATRLGLAVFAFYRFLLLEPFALLRFAYGWNTLWYGRFRGLVLTLNLPILPFVLCAAELIKRLAEHLPWAEVDWKMKGPGRVFFVRPSSFLASLLWDFYLAVSVFCGTFLQYSTHPDGLMHTWYDTICVKEYWYELLDAAGARRPLQLAGWDGASAHNTGPGVTFGRADLVCKISDSYLGIGDKVLKRGKASGGDFDTVEDIQAILAADPAYAGKSAIATEFVSAHPTMHLSGDGYGQVHSLDIVTLRTKAGVRVLTCLLWTDCDTWSSHSCKAGYLVDVHSETVVAPTAWYSPYFATQPSSLIGTIIPGVREACAKAVAAHEASTLPWLTSVGWDCMLTPEGPVFFEGNVASYRTPRRMFLTPDLLIGFLEQCRGKGSPVPSS